MPSLIFLNFPVIKGPWTQFEFPSLFDLKNMDACEIVCPLEGKVTELRLDKFPVLLNCHLSTY